MTSYLGVRYIVRVFASVQEDCSLLEVLHLFFSLCVFLDIIYRGEVCLFKQCHLSWKVFYCKYVYLRISVVLCLFLLMSYNRSYGNNEDFFQANQAKDSSASIRRYCIWFWFLFWFCFLHFYHHDMCFSLLRDPARVRCQDAHWRLPWGGCVCAH